MPLLDGRLIPHPGRRPMCLPSWLMTEAISDFIRGKSEVAAFFNKRQSHRLLSYTFLSLTLLDSRAYLTIKSSHLTAWLAQWLNDQPLPADPRPWTTSELFQSCNQEML
ncbi:hypothetical protein VNO80_13526 [Phaseolus coccineus]|uniref:Uncharacterized protein n=1 Tax=Phaseolus coccineus TaxID=3886 RepID=A0AAN9N164_PHACN